MDINVRTTEGGNISSSWVYISSYSEWFLSPLSSSSHSFYRISYGFVHYNDGSNVVNAYGIRPVVYLKPDIKIINGNGSSDSHYQLSMN